MDIKELARAILAGEQLQVLILGTWFDIDHKNAFDYCLEHLRIKSEMHPMQCLIVSGIDCEFTDDPTCWRIIRKLKEITNGKPSMFIDDGGFDWEYCRPRLDHWHHWHHWHHWQAEDKTPVSDGYHVEVMYIGGPNHHVAAASTIDWSNQNIVAFKVTL